MVSSSTGGKAARNTPSGPKRRKKTTKRASSSRGSRPESERGDGEAAAAPPAATTGVRSDAIVRHLEEAHPAQFGELSLVGVEHVPAVVGEAYLQDGPLCLAEHDRVGELARLQARPRAVDVEEVAVDVDGVDGIELRHVHQVDAHQFVPADPNRVPQVMEGHAVHGVDLVLAVEVRIEGGHHHNHSPRPRAPLRRVDDERPVETLVDVALQGQRVAVVLVKTEGFRVKLVDEALSWEDLPRPNARYSVHLGRVDSVKVHSVGMAARVDELHPDALASLAAEGRAGHRAVEGPRWKEEAWRDLDLLVERDDLELSQDPPVR